MSVLQERFEELCKKLADCPDDDLAYREREDVRLQLGRENVDAAPAAVSIVFETDDDVMFMISKKVLNDLLLCHENGYDDDEQFRLCADNLDNAALFKAVILLSAYTQGGSGSDDEEE